MTQTTITNCLLVISCHYVLFSKCTSLHPYYHLFFYKRKFIYQNKAIRINPNQLNMRIELESKSLERNTLQHTNIKATSETEKTRSWKHIQKIISTSGNLQCYYHSCPPTPSIPILN